MKPNLASSIATEMSMAAASPVPPATACPAIRPTNGLGDRRIRRNRSAGSASIAETDSFVCSERSRPAQNTRPVLVTTMTRTVSSPSASSSAWWNSVTSERLSALRLSSSISVIVNTPASSAEFRVMVEFLSLVQALVVRRRPGRFPASREPPGWQSHRCRQCAFVGSQPSRIPRRCRSPTQRLVGTKSPVSPGRPEQLEANLERRWASGRG